VTAESRLLKWAVGRVREPRSAVPGPVRVVDVELTRPLPALPAGSVGALAVVRLHGEPLGVLHLDAVREGRSDEALTDEIAARLGTEIGDHLRRDAACDLVDATALQAPGCREELRHAAATLTASVVVPTRNRPGQVRACLNSLLALDHPDFEIVLVDNAPSDSRTQSLVADEFADDRRVRYLCEPRPGASRARNLGAEHARGEVVAFTDDDAVVDPEWLSALVAGFAHAPNVDCVTGLTLPTGLETPAQHAFEEYGGYARGFRRRRYDHRTHRGDTLLYPYTAGVFGASNNAAFRRRSFLDRGGFDVRLGPATPAFGAEDLDAFLAVILDGASLVYEPRAVVYHEHRPDFPGLYWQVFTYSAGFTAMLTKWAVRDRDVRADLAHRVPALLPAALVTRHRAGEHVGDYPRQLRWLERAGYLYGPIAYARAAMGPDRGPDRE
jgi:O-antigen biosynthesis protein